MSDTVMTATRTCRLLYFGAENSGKRDNLRLIHQSLPPEQRLALAVEDPERQIAFNLNRPGGENWQVLVQAVDTGQERLRVAGMADRAPFDGIVFVVHSGASKLDQSLAALESMKTFLDTWGRDLMGVPLVIQYNRRDEPQALPVDRLENLLNPWGLLSFPASSKRGEGVRETLKAILGLTVNHLNKYEHEREDSLDIVSAVETVVSPSEESEFAGDEGLVLDYGPPLPGTEVEETTRARGDAIFNEMRPPIVIPVRLPRRLVADQGPVRIVLEVQLEDE